MDQNDHPDSDILQYKKTQQALFINDLLRFNVETLLLDSYSQITDILQNLERIWRTQSVFISGAAHEWGANWPTERAQTFVRGLSKTLVSRGYRLVSGLAYGVNSSVIVGALEQIYKMKRTNIEDQLVLRPFPEQTGEGTWEAAARRYREDMVSYAGTAVFLFGNELIDGNVVLSKGTLQEFDISKEKGLALIPVGATGYMAKELWNKVMADLDTYYPQRTAEFKPMLDTLGNADVEPDALIKAVIRIIELWSQA